jgi:hypothetical protein
MSKRSSSVLATALVAAVLGSLLPTPAAEAAGDRKAGGAAARAGGGGGGGARAAGGGGGAKARPQVDNSRKDVRTNNVRNSSVNNVNNNVNVNRNVNVDVDVDRGGCCGWDNDYHPVATAAAVTATVAVTSAIVGSIVNAPPPGCVPVNYGGIIYQQCGSTWYQPQGTRYVVINPPY